MVTLYESWGHPLAQRQGAYRCLRTVMRVVSPGIVTGNGQLLSVLERICGCCLQCISSKDSRVSNTCLIAFSQPGHSFLGLSPWYHVSASVQSFIHLRLTTPVMGKASPFHFLNFLICSGTEAPVLY